MLIKNVKPLKEKDFIIKQQKQKTKKTFKKNVYKKKQKS